MATHIESALASKFVIILAGTTLHYCEVVKWHYILLVKVLVGTYLKGINWHHILISKTGTMITSLIMWW